MSSTNPVASQVLTGTSFPTHPSVLVFDVNETLIDIESMAPLFDRIFGDPRVLREWFGGVVMYSMTITLSDRYVDFFSLAQGVLRMVARIHQVRVTEEDLRAVMDGMRTMPAHPDVAGGLSRLRDEGYRLVTLTNSPQSPHGPSPLEYAGLGGFFEQQFSVDTLRVFKPAAQLYRHVARQLDVPPSACMMVAAHVWDTIGAQNAGFSSALLTRPGNAALPISGLPQPTLIAPDLHQFAQQLCAMRPAAPQPESRPAASAPSGSATFPADPLPQPAPGAHPRSAPPTAPAVVREQPGGESMRAIILEKFGGLDSLVYADIPKPLPKEGEVVIAVKAFGINHAEMHMRRGEWAEAAEVSGIECVGVVDSCPGGEFPVGAKVAALMGGLGRTINGSYAEYTRVRASNVALIDSELPWAQLAALPETYATAWTCLFRNLDLTAGQLLLIRGATSSFGRAALKMAVGAGARVIATTRSRERFAMLEGLGAARVELEMPNLATRIAEAKQIDAVLDLVGNSTILDSLDMLRRGGTACLAGWLGGLDPIPDFNPLLRMASGVNLTFFGSFVFGTPGFPLSDVPLQEIARQVQDGRLEAKPSRVFSFEQIHEAHRIMEAGEAGGKMVVVLE